MDKISINEKARLAAIREKCLNASADVILNGVVPGEEWYTVEYIAFKSKNDHKKYSPFLLRLLSLIMWKPVKNVYDNGYNAIPCFKLSVWMALYPRDTRPLG